MPGDLTLRMPQLLSPVTKCCYGKEKFGALQHHLIGYCVLSLDTHFCGDESNPGFNDMEPISASEWTQ